MRSGLVSRMIDGRRYIRSSCLIKKKATISRDDDEMTMYALFAFPYRNRARVDFADGSSGGPCSRLHTGRQNEGA
jgi:hypothetical protein